MDNTHRDDHEPLIEGLDTLPEDSFRLPQPSDDFRSAILDRTGRIVRARAHRRRLVVLAFVAAAYIGGIMTALLLTESVIPDGKGGDEAVAELSDSFIEPGELVHDSESAPLDERIRLLQQAGDLYLYAKYDVEKALDCYRRALNAMPASRQTMVEIDDSWLLAAVKDARK